MPQTSGVVRVSEVMTSHVRTGEPTSKLTEVWELLADERCHHLPIVDAGRVVGMISTRDLVRLASRRGSQRVSAGDYEGTAADVMSTDLETIHVRAPVETAIDRIGRGDIHALVVVDDAGDLAGIVTHRDLLHYLVS